MGEAGCRGGAGAGRVWSSVGWRGPAQAPRPQALPDPWEPGFLCIPSRPTSPHPPSKGMEVLICSVLFASPVPGANLSLLIQAPLWPPCPHSSPAGRSVQGLAEHGVHCNGFPGNTRWLASAPGGGSASHPTSSSAKGLSFRYKTCPPGAEKALGRERTPQTFLGVGENTSVTTLQTAAAFLQVLWARRWVCPGPGMCIHDGDQDSPHRQS